MSFLTGFNHVKDIWAGFKTMFKPNHTCDCLLLAVLKNRPVKYETGLTLSKQASRNILVGFNRVKNVL